MSSITKSDVNDRYHSELVDLACRYFAPLCLSEPSTGISMSWLRSQYESMSTEDLYRIVYGRSESPSTRDAAHADQLTNSTSVKNPENDNPLTMDAKGLASPSSLSTKPEHNPKAKQGLSKRADLFVDEIAHNTPSGAVMEEKDLANLSLFDSKTEFGPEAENELLRDSKIEVSQVLSSGSSSLENDEGYVMLPSTRPPSRHEG